MPSSHQTTMNSIPNALSKSIKKLRTLQLDDGRWEGSIDFGTYPTSLTLFLLRFLQSKTDELHEQMANWIASSQRADGGWGTIWTRFPEIEGQLNDIAIEQVRRNTATALLALKHMTGYDQAVKKGDDWLQQYGKESNDPLDQTLLAIAGNKPWPRASSRDCINLLFVDLEKALPVWMIELVAGPTLANCSKQSGKMFPLAKLVKRKLTKLLLSRQLRDGSWFGTVDHTVYALLGLQLAKADRREAYESALRFLKSKIDPSQKTIRRFSIPTWDTARSLLALKTAGIKKEDPAVNNAAQYLLRSAGKPAAWSFTPETSRYPDCDDTALSLSALISFNYIDKNHSGFKWLQSMQNKDEGWAAFLHNHKPPTSGRPDLEDNSTPDVTAHALEALARAGYTKENQIIANAVKYLEKCQMTDGSWYGRWGLCYIYGTSQVLKALHSIGMKNERFFQKAIHWLMNIQNPDGGWGEHPSSYYLYRHTPSNISSAAQTAWAIEALLTATPPQHDTIAEGIRFLLETQSPDGSWPSYPTSAALEIYENSLDCLVPPFTALAIIESRSVKSS